MCKQIFIYLFSFVFAAGSTSLAAENTGTTTIQMNRTAQELPQQRGGNSGGSINSESNKAKEKNSSAATIAYAVGGAMFAGAATAAGFQQWSLSAMLAGMGGMAMLQGANNSKSASEAGGTATKTASGMGFAGNADVGKYPIDDPLIKSIVDVEKAKEGMALAKKMGIDGKSPIKIGGKEYSPSDFASRESMLAAGLPKDMVNTALAIAAKAEKAAIAKLGALTATQGFEESGGSAAKAAAVAAPVDYSSNSSGNYGQSRNVASLNTAGLTKNFNGEPIGVAADSIFAMMTRRYKLKEKQNSFIDELGVNLQK